MKSILPLITLILGFSLSFLLPRSGQVESVDKPVDEVTGEAKGSGTSISKADSSSGSAKESALQVLIDEPSMDEDWLEELGALDAFDQIGVLHASLKGLPASDYPKLMEAMNLNENSVVGWQIKSMIAARWSQVDPQGMLAYTKLQNNRESWGLNNAVFTAWTKQDPQAAYAAALNMNTQRSQEAAMQAVVSTIASENPQEAIQMATDYYGDPLRSRGRWIFQSIYRNWAKVDCAAARQSALSLDEGPFKAKALTGAMSDWMAEDPVSALAWLDELPMDGSVYGARKEVYQNFLNQDFDVAKEYIASLDDPLDRRQIVENLHFHNLGWQKSYEEIEGVFDWLGTVAKGQVFDNRVRSVINAMAETDPDRAIDFVLNMRPGNARMNGLNSLGSKLVEVDPVHALAFVNSLPYEDEKRKALSSMGWRLSGQSVESVSGLIAGSEDPLVQRQLASRISGEWSDYDQAAALAWSESLTDEKARKSAVRAVLNNWIESDPPAALDYVNNLPEGNDKASFLRDAYSNWARNDPQAAVQWLDQLPDALEEQKPDIYRGVANNFINHDPMAASEWIGTLDDGPARDQTVEALVKKIAKTDPEAGFIWSATVGDGEKRKDTLRLSVEAWAKEDPDKAYDAIVAASISAQEKAPLLEIVEGKR